jgi:hypothetical protein
MKLHSVRLYNTLAITTLLLTSILVIPAIATAESGEIIMDEMALAMALVQDPTWVTSSSFVTTPNVGASGVFDTPLTFFPSGSDDQYAVLSTGYVADIPKPGTKASSNLLGDKVRGDTDFDVTIWEIGLEAPLDVDCLSFDLQFLSEEYPEYVGRIYNDAFIAELDISDWTTDYTTIIAPNNFAFDSLGNVISVNSVVGFAAGNGAGTAFDMTGDDPNNGGATGKLSVYSPITPGPHMLYFSIFDQVDLLYDSAVFIDNLRLFDSGGNCKPGIAYFLIYLPLLES